MEQAIDIVTVDQTTKFSKPFRVDKGFVVVITSRNFNCEVKNEIGEVTRPHDCAVLHMVSMSGEILPELESCRVCQGVILDLNPEILSSEPVVQEGSNWTHNSQNNISVITVPGYYMFELCNEDSIGTVTMQAQELSIEQAMLLPRGIFHGEV